MRLEEFLKTKYDYNPDVKNVLQTYIDQWKSWYKSNVRDFHNYFIYNGNKKVKQKRFTMSMAKQISEEWSDILWSEKCKISLKDENSQKQFDELTGMVLTSKSPYNVLNSAKNWNSAFAKSLG